MYNEKAGVSIHSRISLRHLKFGGSLIWCLSNVLKFNSKSIRNPPSECVTQQLYIKNWALFEMQCVCSPLNDTGNVDDNEKWRQTKWTEKTFVRISQMYHYKTSISVTVAGLKVRVSSGNCGIVLIPKRISLVNTRTISLELNSSFANDNHQFARIQNCNEPNIFQCSLIHLCIRNHLGFIEKCR